MNLEKYLTSEQLSFIEKWKNQDFNIDNSVEVEDGKLILDIFLFKLINVVPIDFRISGPVDGFQKADFGIIDKFLQKTIGEAKEVEKFIKRSLKREEEIGRELKICQKSGEDFSRRNLRHPDQYTLN